MLIGFKPDYIKIIENGLEEIHDELLIGIVNDKLSIDNNYRGLLNLSILNRGNLNVNKN